MPKIVKEFEMDNQQDWLKLEQLEQEEAILGSLNDPRLPKYLGKDIELGKYSWFYEIPEGKTLGGNPSFPQFKVIASNLFNLIDYLQTEGVVHGNITLDNLVLLGNGKIFLQNFELARRERSNEDVLAAAVTLLAWLSGATWEDTFRIAMSQGAALSKLLAQYPEALTNWFKQILCLSESQRWNPKQAIEGLNLIPDEVEEILIKVDHLKLPCYRGQVVSGNLTLDSPMGKETFKGSVCVFNGLKDSLFLAQETFELSDRQIIPFTIQTQNLLPNKQYEWNLLLSYGDNQTLIPVKLDTYSMVIQRKLPILTIIVVYLGSWILTLLGRHLLDNWQQNWWLSFLVLIPLGALVPNLLRKDVDDVKKENLKDKIETLNAFLFALSFVLAVTFCYAQFTGQWVVIAISTLVIAPIIFWVLSITTHFTILTLGFIILPILILYLLGFKGYYRLIQSIYRWWERAFCLNGYHQFVPRLFLSPLAFNIAFLLFF
jgi:hypothetical protein